MSLTSVGKWISGFDSIFWRAEIVEVDEVARVVVE
jgi:hypothetical protein